MKKKEPNVGNTPEDTGSQPGSADKVLQQLNALSKNADQPTAGKTNQDLGI